MAGRSPKALKRAEYVRNLHEGLDDLRGDLEVFAAIDRLAIRARQALAIPDIKKAFAHLDEMSALAYEHDQLMSEPIRNLIQQLHYYINITGGRWGLG